MYVVGFGVRVRDWASWCEGEKWQERQGKERKGSKRREGEVRKKRKGRKGGEEKERKC